MKTKYIFSALLVTIAILSLGLYWQFHVVKAPEVGIVPNIPVSTSTPSNQATSTVNSTGSSVIKDKYELFVQNSFDKENNYLPQTKYFDDGIIGSGKYAGYHRLIGFVSANDPSNGTSFIFATKDYKTFILDKDSTSKYFLPLLGQPDSPFNSDKVVLADTVPMDFPKVIEQGNYILVRGLINFDAQIGTTPELPSIQTNLKFFPDIVNVKMPTSGEGYAKGYEEFYKTEQQYLAATTKVFVQDQAGLVFEYQLVTKESYLREKAKNSEYPNYQTYYTNLDLNNDSGLYNSYGQLYPWGCGNLGASYVLKNISESDLTKRTSTQSGQDVYVLSDKNHPIYKAAYFAKVTAFKDYFDEMNKKPVPDFQSYVAKNPVLIVKDNWGRWLGLGELEYQIPGGCGKPVIYLYPEKPTEVLVKFLAPINFTVSIPNYAGQWRVLANPNGQLKDLQAEKTNCSNINFNFVGSEYAKDSCASATYPYLYWSGQVAGNYFQPTEGWVVGRGELEKFLNEKLNILGLSTKEKNDMVSYWLPQMLKKDAAYYRLAFLQTPEVNKLFPMLVTPKPDTTFRIFLDWQPLVSGLASQLSPQELTPLVRKGFTLVEWGGLKQ